MLQVGVPSSLATTKAESFSQGWRGVNQFVRKGPEKAFYAPDMAPWAQLHSNEVGIYHGHGFYVYPNLLFGRQARKEKKPLVYHVHGFLDPWIRARSPLKKKLVHLLFENANFRHVSFWRALSEKERGQIHNVVGKQARVVVLPNGVHLPNKRTEEEIEVFKKMYPKKRPKRLLFLSRIHAKKGIDLLLRAWADLPASLRDEWEIALFGPDERGYQKEVETLAKALNLVETCRFYGSVSGPEKEAAFRSADLFVLPSRSEGFPMALLEAASYGLPVIQTDECNFPELTAAEGAWEGKPEVDSLRQLLLVALNADDAERRERGERGRALVERDYQWSTIAEKVAQACRRFA